MQHRAKLLEVVVVEKIVSDRFRESKGMNEFGRIIQKMRVGRPNGF
jgi:hypothetical protein